MILCFLAIIAVDHFFVSLSACSYHDNAFIASRALHIVNSLNSSATFHLLELFFEQQVGVSTY